MAKRKRSDPDNNTSGGNTSQSAAQAFDITNLNSLSEDQLMFLVTAAPFILGIAARQAVEQNRSLANNSNNLSREEVLSGLNRLDSEIFGDTPGDLGLTLDNFAPTNTTNTSNDNPTRPLVYTQRELRRLRPTNDAQMNQNRFSSRQNRTQTFNEQNQSHNSDSISTTSSLDTTDSTSSNNPERRINSNRNPDGNSRGQ